MLGGRRVSPSQPGLTSIVMPVYQVREWLDESICSVVAQTASDWELIAVDDGSTDGSAEILAGWAQREPRIRVLTVRNGGLGKARNRGLAEARGEQVMFVDSDDRLPPDALARLSVALRDSGADYATGPGVRFTASGEASPYWTQKNSIFDDGPRVVDVRQEGRLVLDYVAWNKLHRRDALLASRFAFPEGTLFEDVVPAVHGALVARSVAIIDRPVYEHRRREGSITTGILDPRSLKNWMTQLSAAWTLIVDRAPDSSRWQFGRRFLRVEAWSRLAALAEVRDPRAVRELGLLVARVWNDSSRGARAGLGGPRTLVYLIAASGGLPALAEALRSMGRRLSEASGSEPELADDTELLLGIAARKGLLPSSVIDGVRTSEGAP